MGLSQKACDSVCQGSMLAYGVVMINAVVASEGLQCIMIMNKI